MSGLFLVVAFFVAGCSASSLLIASGVQPGLYPQTKSAVVNDYDDIRTCELIEAKSLMREDTKLRQMIETNAGRGSVTSVVVLYVYDVTEMPLPGMAVMVVDEGRSRTRSVVTATTDNTGMAVLNVRPGERYRLQITSPGWIPFTTDAKSARRSMTRLMRVVMRLPSIH